ncbi:YceI family protein [Biformimicrobium ophioploci]|uniref:YceI family protein n=1 Tax=Biformimicrobium ophioploci TaxID=3036711 RepID=A0ABQ6M0X9_9GAMM|nr:YceI family protein [Microbulbifer sp. NKW57]GMG87990.1 YceI family protein [Microbulbifer sp. NKW57]
MKKLLASAALATATLAMSALATAADYKIDTKGAHASITFKIQHLGYSWLHGRFNTFDGGFSYDADKPEASSINVEIDTASVDSNHAERDKHLRSKDFLNVRKHPKATFVSTSIKDSGNGKMAVTGDLTLNGVTRSIVIDAEKVGEGKDPWGGYRAGFTGTTRLKLKDFNIEKSLGPAATHVEMVLDVEGIRQ